ncbi:MAG: hypothetical protein ACOYB8_10935 [Eubacteriaceae bacterium]|jgi:hypothetical protein
MKLSQVKQLLDAQVLTGGEFEEDTVEEACGCDLMSDVLKYAKENAVLLTGLVNKQVLNTADMANMHSIVFVRDKIPTREILEMADDIGMLIMRTSLPMFQACGILYQNGLRGARPKEKSDEL